MPRKAGSALPVPEAPAAGSGAACAYAIAHPLFCSASYSLPLRGRWPSVARSEGVSAAGLCSAASNIADSPCVFSKAAGLCRAFSNFAGSPRAPSKAAGLCRTPSVAPRQLPRRGSLFYRRSGASTSRAQARAGRKLRQGASGEAAMRFRPGFRGSQRARGASSPRGFQGGRGPLVSFQGGVGGNRNPPTTFFWTGRGPFSFLERKWGARSLGSADP